MLAKYMAFDNPIFNFFFTIYSILSVNITMIIIFSFQRTFTLILKSVQKHKYEDLYSYM